MVDGESSDCLVRLQRNMTIMKIKSILLTMVLVATGMLLANMTYGSTAKQEPPGISQTMPTTCDANTEMYVLQPCEFVSINPVKLFPDMIIHFTKQDFEKPYFYPYWQSYSWQDNNYFNLTLKNLPDISVKQSSFEVLRC